jgi:hypothetical protein
MELLVHGALAAQGRIATGFTLLSGQAITTRKRPIAANIIAGAPKKVPAGAKYYRRTMIRARR